MSPETVDAIQKALQPVADKIGQGAQFGWEVVLRQQMVDAIGCFLFAFAGFILIGLGIALYVYYRKINKGVESWYNRRLDEAPTLSAAMSFAGAVVMFTGLYGGIARLINPAYYALDFFIHLAK